MTRIRQMTAAQVERLRVLISPLITPALQTKT